jgi:hypothetical protein
MALIGPPLALFFGFIAWLISPSHVKKGHPGALARLQERLFVRLGIEWLTGPARTTKR